MRLVGRGLMGRIPIWARVTAVIVVVLGVVLLGTTLLGASSVGAGQGSRGGMSGMDHSQGTPGGRAAGGMKTMDHAAGQGGDHSSAQHSRDGGHDGR